MGSADPARSRSLAVLLRLIQSFPLAGPLAHEVPSDALSNLFLQKSLNQSNTFNHGRPQIGIRYVTVSQYPAAAAACGAATIRSWSWGGAALAAGLARCRRAEKSLQCGARYFLDSGLEHFWIIVVPKPLRLHRPLVLRCAHAVVPDVDNVPSVLELKLPVLLPCDHVVRDLLSGAHHCHWLYDRWSRVAYEVIFETDERVFHLPRRCFGQLEFQGESLQLVAILVRFHL